MFLQVKIVPYGTIQECRFVDGIVFTKTLGSKSSKRKFDKPRVLLLDCSLEYQTEAGLLDLEDVEHQEPRYLYSIVKKIQTLRPDLVLASHSISRLAQQYLKNANIPFAQQVKLEVIKRISQWTGATIVKNPSSNELEKADLGQVNHIKVKTYSGEWGILFFRRFFCLFK